MSQWKGYSPDNVLAPEAAQEAGPESAANTGTLTYEPYYGLKAKPFSLSTDPRSLYKSPTHTAVLDDLLTAIRRREGLIVLTGDMGTGKTTLCRAALYQLDRKTFATFVPDPFLSREDLLRMLLVDFGEVSVDDLRRGRLSGSSRPDLSHQLFEFLTSLESVDAFAVLLIDEAQHLGQSLLEEIRALSELESGRRLLQIVLVGQPELQTSLKKFHMRHIDQRVTMRCELHPLTKEDVAAYVAHRLAMAGGTRERVAFANAAIEMIHAASNGVPRLVNVICDRALALGYLERTSVIGPPVIAEAIEHLHMRPFDAAQGRPVDAAPAAPSSPPAYEDARVEPEHKTPVVEQRSPSPRVSTDAMRVRGGASTPAFDLAALLDMPANPPRRESAAVDDQDRSTASHAQTWRARVDREARRDSRVTLKVAGLAVLGMAVMLIGGGFAVMAQRSRPVGASLGASSAAAVAPRQAATPHAIGQPAAAAASSRAAAAAVQAQTAIVPAVRPTSPEGPVVQQAAAVPAAPPVSAASQGSWIVQVAAFSGPQRAQATVQRLAQAGLPAFEVATDTASRGVLYFVRVGPFKTSAEAEAALASVRKFSDLDGAFVRSVSSNP